MLTSQIWFKNFVKWLIGWDNLHSPIVSYSGFSESRVSPFGVFTPRIRSSLCVAQVRTKSVQRSKLIHGFPICKVSKGEISVWTHHYNACISKVGSTGLQKIFKCFSFISCIFSTDISHLYFILIWISVEGTKKHYRQSYGGGGFHHCFLSDMTHMKYTQTCHLWILYCTLLRG